jgi:hypothetical protein
MYFSVLCIIYEGADNSMSSIGRGAELVYARKPGKHQGVIRVDINLSVVVFGLAGWF